VLRSILRTRADLRRRLKRCEHCNIFFLTDPRNADRDDLRCPFGCRQAHRTRAASQRSAAYYRTEAGKIKKRALNEKRRNSPTLPEATAEPVVTQAPLTPLSAERFDPEMVSYLRMVTGVIEGRRVSRQEILETLRRVVRQHSMAAGGNVLYRMCRWNRQPP